MTGREGRSPASTITVEVDGMVMFWQIPMRRSAFPGLSDE